MEPLEEVIDVMVERLRDQHIRRLKDGMCSIDTGVVFLDVLNNASASPTTAPTLRAHDRHGGRR